LRFSASAWSFRRTKAKTSATPARCAAYRLPMAPQPMMQTRGMADSSWMLISRSWLWLLALGSCYWLMILASGGAALQRCNRATCFTQNPPRPSAARKSQAFGWRSASALHKELLCTAALAAEVSADEFTSGAKSPEL
jgi:hypothetical protein